MNTCILYVQKFTVEKKAYYDAVTSKLQTAEVRQLIRSDAEFDYSIFMGTAEFVGFEPSGRSIIETGEKTDLDLLLEDFESKETIISPDVDLFDFASRFYGEKSFRRKEQTVRGTTKGLKTSFTLNLSETEDRLDPPYYLWRSQANTTLNALQPLGSRVSEVKDRLKLLTEDDKDRDFTYASVSSDGVVSLADVIRGEDFTSAYKPKKVSARDFIYNPMRINIGSIGLVPEHQEGVITSPDYVVFRANGIDPQYLLSLLRSPFYRMYIDVITTGSIRDRLYFADLQKLRVPDVPQSEQRLVAEFGKRVGEQSSEMMKEIRAQRARVTDRLHSLVHEAVVAGASTSIEESFKVLAGKWKRETGILSSISKKIKHPSYQAIIALGEPVLPLLLAELVANPDHWFAALEKITGENPVNASDRKDIDKAIEAWASWGFLKGYGVNA